MLCCHDNVGTIWAHIFSFCPRTLQMFSCECLIVQLTHKYVVSFITHAARLHLQLLSIRINCEAEKRIINVETSCTFSTCCSTLMSYCHCESSPSECTNQGCERVVGLCLKLRVVFLLRFAFFLHKLSCSDCKQIRNSFYNK